MLEEAMQQVVKTCPQAVYSEMLMAALLCRIDEALAREYLEDVARQQEELREAALCMATDEEIEKLKSE